MPGKPEESLLIKRITAESAAMRMPPAYSHKTLTQAQKDTLRTWIAQGAPWKEHWAFIPPVKAPAPEVKNTAWPGTISIAFAGKDGVSSVDSRSGMRIAGL